MSNSLKYSVLGGPPRRATTSCRVNPISFLLSTRSSAIRRRTDADVRELPHNDGSKWRPGRNTNQLPPAKSAEAARANTTLNFFLMRVVQRPCIFLRNLD